MKKYPYSLIVRKVIFCACSDLLGRLRQARPDETDHYKTVQVAPIKGAGPLLIEYSLKKRWPENDKDRQRQYLGRILQLQNGVSIVFHKKSGWRIEFRDAAGNIIDRCKRNDKAEAIRQKIKNSLEDAYPHYKNFNLSERFVETLIKPFRDIWMDFVDISKKALSPLCEDPNRRSCSGTWVIRCFSLKVTWNFFQLRKAVCVGSLVQSTPWILSTFRTKAMVTGCGFTIVSRTRGCI